MTVVDYEPTHREEMLELALRSWAPVFEELRGAVPRFVYDNFWPEGWETRQREDLAQVVDEAPELVDVAILDGLVVGWVVTRIHAEDSMGEVHVIVVDPEVQRQGIASVLLERSHQRIRDAGMRMVMVETGDDPGHGPARAVYEANGYRRWPVARYFKDLTE
ncbi:MAG TPA: GNAT family N-acetyltransferase [Candidatus Corynebacterium avicola]|uniref:GNAT family N-acetyltransferase n=1 Tax=Candidatus Corynebacterium avicola TaxID=2838527 RepID=A0A9D1RNS7_9CORY|nr:GNAT family N-acetyltransferase [Candidatus Corynebacterium avicola]